MTAESRAAPIIGAERRVALAETMRTLALWTLAGLIVVSPFRARAALADRASPLYSDYVDFLLFASDAFLLGILLLWGLSLALQPRPVWSGPNLVRWPVAGLLVAICLSIPFSVDSSLAAYNAIRTIFAVLLALYVINEVKSVRQLAPAIAVMVVVQAVVGVGQVIEQESLGLAWLGEKLLDADLPGSSIIWTVDEPRLLRAYGLSDHPNILGGLLACGSVLIATALSRTRTLWTALLTVIFALGTTALLVTFSRAAILAFVVGVALVFLLLAYWRDWSHLSLWLTACVAAVVVSAAFIAPYAPYLGARVNPSSQPAGSTEGRSLDERSALAKNTNEIFVSNPILGVGVGATPVAMAQEYPNFAFNYQPAHVVLLDVAAETGLLGALSYGLLMLTPWALLWWRRHRLTPELIGASGALLALHVLGLFDYYTWLFVSGRIWFWLVLAVWVVAYRNSTRSAVDA